MIRTALLILCSAITACAQIVITELCRDPAGGATSSPGDASHEFVEITNFGVDTFKLDSLCLTDGVEADDIVPWPSPLALHGDCITGGAMLAPGRTALILDRDYPAAALSVPSSRLAIAPGTLLLTVSDADLGNGLAFDDGVLIYKGTKSSVNRVVACAADQPWSGTNPAAGKITLTEPPSPPEGPSIVPVSLLFGPARWEVCPDSLTPGRFELLKNGWFTEWKFSPIDGASRAVVCTLACCKAGAAVTDSVRWSVFGASGSQTAVAAEGFLSVKSNRCSATFSLCVDSLSYTLQLTENGVHTEWPFDLSQLWTPRFPLRINEIFPRASASEPEWFELVNVSSMPINLKNWQFGNGEDSALLSTTDRILNKGDFLVVTANGALFGSRYPAKNRILVPPRWHTLNNYNDTLRLRDNNRAVKETVCYRSEWFTNWTTQSLERISPAATRTDRASWTLAARPTPGQPNGALSAAGAHPSLVIGPSPFTPNNDGRDDLLAITPSPLPGSTATVSIYAFSGKKIRAFSGITSPTIFWDGKMDNGSPAPVGPFFVVLEMRTESGISQLRQKGILWR
jgi:hypothetical protein